MISLKKSEKFSGVEGPLVTVVMDGIGIGRDEAENAIYKANTPTLNMLMRIM